MYNVYYVSLHIQSILHFIVLLHPLILISFCPLHYIALFCSVQVPLQCVLFSDLVLSMNVLYFKVPDCVNDIYSCVFRALLFVLLSEH